METERINRRVGFIVQWSPLFLTLASVWVFLSWRNRSLNIPYILACVAVGLFCGALIILERRKNSSPLLYVLWIMVFFSAPLFLNEVFFPGLNDAEDKLSFQYTSIVVASIFSLVVIFRKRIIRHVAPDARQSIGSERGLGLS
jgi:hypothetical protein